MISNKIKELRLNNNYSIEKYADLIGVSKNTIINWEKGVSSPNYDFLIKIAKLHNISISYFEEDTNNAVSLDDNENQKNKKSFFKLSSIVYLIIEPIIFVFFFVLCIINYIKNNNDFNPNNYYTLLYYMVPVLALSFIDVIIHIILCVTKKKKISFNNLISFISLILIFLSNIVSFFLFINNLTYNVFLSILLLIVFIGFPLFISFLIRIFNENLQL